MGHFFFQGLIYFLIDDVQLFWVGSSFFGGTFKIVWLFILYHWCSSCSGCICHSYFQIYKMVNLEPSTFFLDLFSCRTWKLLQIVFFAHFHLTTTTIFLRFKWSVDFFSGFYTCNIQICHDNEINLLFSETSEIRIVFNNEELLLLICLPKSGVLETRCNNLSMVILGNVVNNE